MIRKTFTTKPEAIKYKEDMISQGGVAVLGKLGDKYRVYVNTKEMIELSQHWTNKEYTANDARRFLRGIAWTEGDAVEDALALQKMMADGSLYSDYEAIIQAARIMEGIKELKYAKDVFDFLDSTDKYDKVMKQFIEDTLQEYDYEAKEETATV